MVAWSVPKLLARSHSPQLTTRETVRQDVDEWIKELKNDNIRSIICLMDVDEIEMFYGNLPGGLLGYYRDNGFKVKHVPAKDYKAPALNSKELEKTWHAFNSLPKPVLIHCRQGISRTGRAIDYLEDKLQKKEKASTIPMRPLQIAQAFSGLPLFAFLSRLFA